MSPLTRREQQILRSYGGWMLAAILTRPDTGTPQARASQSGASHYRVGSDEYHWMQTTPAGIELRDREHRTIETLTWTRIRRHADSLPASLVERIEAATRDCQEHMRTWRPFKASGAAEGCRQAPAIGPSTQAQARYADEHDRWWATVAGPYYADSRRLDAARELLLDEALPLAGEDAEPGDLLELLAATTTVRKEAIVR
jgi:hypothetical protein